MADLRVCLFGQGCAPLVEPVARDLSAAARSAGHEIVPLAVEALLAQPERWEEIGRAYVLPLDLPARFGPDPQTAWESFAHRYLPRTEIVNSVAAHERTRDKRLLVDRLLSRGVPLPETAVTDDPQEARAFVRTHEQAVLKNPISCGGLDDFVVFLDDDGTLAAEARGRRYALELEPPGAAPRLDHGVLAYPGPFFLQRLIAGVGRRGVLSPAQVLRAYVVDGQILFWTERYRERTQRPSDFIVSAALGARCRFLRDVSGETSKIALRAAEVLGVRIGAVDLVRSGAEGPRVLGVCTDGPQAMIDRQFKQIPEFRNVYDLDARIAEAIVAPAADTAVRRADTTPPGRG